MNVVVSPKAAKYLKGCIDRIPDAKLEALRPILRLLSNDEPIIEDYPDDYPYPSALILGNGLHIVSGLGDGMLWLITAYRPSPEQWEDDLKTRKVIK